MTLFCRISVEFCILKETIQIRNNLNWPDIYCNGYRTFPIEENDVLLIDEMRRKRNSVGHYFGRKKDDYEAPLSFFPEPIEPISHDKLLKYFKLVHKIVSNLDAYLKDHYLGSYDIIKYYLKCVEKGDICGQNVADHAKELRKLLGSFGMKQAEANYYRNLVSYVCLPDEKNVFIYGKKASAKIIRDELKKLGVNLFVGERTVVFKEHALSTIINYFSIKDNSAFCEKRGTEKHELFFSKKALDFIIEKIVEDPHLLESINQSKEA